MNSIHGCEAVLAFFYNFSQTCGVAATKQVPDEYGTQRFLCDEHFEAYLAATIPNPETYDFWRVRNEPGYDPDDFDEESYWNDLHDWELIRDQEH